MSPIINLGAFNPFVYSRSILEGYFMTNQRVISRNTGSCELDSDYKWGFTMDIDEEAFPKGLSEDVVKLISAKGTPL